MAELSDSNASAIAERFKALGEPMRLRLLQALRGGECSVGELAERTGGGQANVSKHLSVLKRAGLVDSRRDGLNVFYHISDEGVFTICRNVCDSIELRVDREHQTIVEGREQMNRASQQRR